MYVRSPLRPSQFPPLPAGRPVLDRRRSVVFVRSSSPAVRSPAGGWTRAGAPMRRRGMGQTVSTTQLISAGVSTGAASTASILVALGAVTGPVGAAIAAVGAVASLLVNVFKGCGQTCVEASDIANQVEQALQQNLTAYMSAPIHYQSLQTAAMNNFNTAWTALTQACGNPSLATAGQNCISERQNGACSYKTSPGGWQQNSAGQWSYVSPGANGSGSTCWNWFVGYYDPIANDPTVVADPASNAVSSAATAAGNLASPVLAAMGLNPNTEIFGIPLSTLAIPAAALVLLLLMD